MQETFLDKHYTLSSGAKIILQINRGMGIWITKCQTTDYGHLRTTHVLRYKLKSKTKLAFYDKSA